MSTWEILTAGIALLAGTWGRVRSAFEWIWGLIVVTVDLRDAVGTTILHHLDKESGGHYRYRRRKISSYVSWVRPLRRTCQIAYDQFPQDSMTFWIMRRPIWFRIIDKAGYVGSLSFIRGTIDIDAMIVSALTSSSESAPSRFYVSYHFGKDRMGTEAAMSKGREIAGNDVTYDAGLNLHRTIGWRREDIGRDFTPPHGLDGLSLTPELHEVAREMRRWLTLEDWYAVRGISWRRGYLFDGPPGTGKTAFARAMAEDLDVPIHAFDLATLSNRDLRDEWGKAIGHAPCIVIMEDVDAVFHGRENVTDGGMTFDALLNVVDGVERSRGVLLILTTNHLELVDPALANRPGRIDRVVTFGPLDLDGRMKLARRIIADEARAARIAVDAGAVPAARFIETCCRVALEGAYEGDGAPTPYRAAPGS
jgi:hypothetical protein